MTHAKDLENLKSPTFSLSFIVDQIESDGCILEKMRSSPIGNPSPTYHLWFHYWWKNQKTQVFNPAWFYLKVWPESDFPSGWLRDPNMHFHLMRDIPSEKFYAALHELLVIKKIGGCKYITESGGWAGLGRFTADMKLFSVEKYPERGYHNIEIG